MLLAVLAGCGGQAGDGGTPLPITTPAAISTPTPPPTATNTPAPPPTATNLPAPPLTATSTAEPPSATSTPVPAQPTATPVPPTVDPTATATTGPVNYTVQPGDSLSGIAARYGISQDVLAAANGITDPNRIYAGQVLTIPGPDWTPPTATPVPPTATPAPPTATPEPTATLPPAGTVVQYTVQPGDSLSALARRYDTTVDAIAAHNQIDNPSLIFSGTVLTIVVGDKTTRPAPTATPTAVPPTPVEGSGGSGTKWIEVDLATQTLRAYEGDTVVYQTAVSTGVPAYPTVRGTFHIYQKLLADDMRGGSGADAYYLPNVPYVMYFYTGGYALHGTYWHHNFGHPMSHGCVNLPTPAAEWLFYWAPLGTTVQVH